MAANGRLEARVAEHDRQIAAIRKLILQGMKMINALTEAQRKTAEAQRKTDAQLRRTDARFEAFIRSLQQGPNGHNKGRMG